MVRVSVRKAVEEITKDDASSTYFQSFFLLPHSHLVSHTSPSEGRREKNDETKTDLKEKKKAFPPPCRQLIFIIKLWENRRFISHSL